MKHEAALSPCATGSTDPRAACAPPCTSDSRPRGSSPTLYSTAYTRALGVLSCDLRNVAIVHCRYCLCSSARGCAVALPRHKPAHFTTKRSGRVNPQSGGSAAATQPHGCVPPPTVTGGGCGGSKSAGVCVRSALLAAFPLLQDGGAAARSASDRGTATPKDEAPRAERRERHAKGYTKGPYTPLAATAALLSPPCTRSHLESRRWPWAQTRGQTSPPCAPTPPLT